MNELISYSLDFKESLNIVCTKEDLEYVLNRLSHFFGHYQVKNKIIIKED